MRVLKCKVNPQAELTCDCDGCLGCRPEAYVMPCAPLETVEMFVVRGTNTTIERGTIYAGSEEEAACFVSEDSGWSRIGEEAFYHKEDAELQAEKKRRSAIAYHEKALEELRRKNP